MLFILIIPGIVFILCIMLLLKKPCFISHGYIIHCFVILSSIKKIIFSKKEKTLRIIIILKVFVTCFRRVFR